MLEFKSFGEVDLNSTPIVVLGCGHFFTAETLDGHVGMAEVYDMDLDGGFVGLREMSGEMTQSVPRCPDCQRPIRQFSTQRYNRVINRAVNDEMSKRFLLSGKARLQELEGEANKLELELEKSRQELIDLAKLAGTDINPVKSVRIVQKLEVRQERRVKLTKEVALFLDKVANKDQPARKLHDAMVKAIRASQSINEQMEALKTTNDIRMVSLDRQVLLGGRVVQLKVESTTLADNLEIRRNLGSILDDGYISKIPGGDPAPLSTSFFASCEQLIVDCDAENQPKSGVEARLYYGRIACLHQSYSFAAKRPEDTGTTTIMTTTTAHVQRAKTFLAEAAQLCAQGFFQNADGLQTAVEETLRLLGKQWYEPVSAAELATIKAAMVSGAGGLATHSGHWYKCQNGHPVSYHLFLSFSIAFVFRICFPHWFILAYMTMTDSIFFEPLVRRRRVWHAHGADSLSGVRRPCWWTTPYTRYRRDSGN